MRQLSASSVGDILAGSCHTKLKTTMKNEIFRLPLQNKWHALVAIGIVYILAKRMVL
jgi:hypothetical protein